MRFGRYTAKLFAFKPTIDLGVPVRYPIIGKPFIGEMGPLEGDEWYMRNYSIFLFRHCIGLEVTKWRR